MAERVHERDVLVDRIGALDIIGDGFYAGSVGGSVVAIFFLVVDAVNGVPLFTPSLVGSVLLEGAAPGANVAVNLQMVAATSALHAMAFVSFGIVCAWVLARLHEVPDLPLVAIICFVALEVGVVAAGRLISPDLGAAIGHGLIASANVLAAIGMSVWLVHFARHLGDEEE